MRRRGATLIELIVSIAIIGIMAAATGGIIVYLMKMSVYLPREMKARSIAHDAMDIMIEGEAQRRGARYAAQIIDASDSQFTYTFGYPGSADKRNLRLELYNGKICRSYTTFGGSTYGSRETIPYYATQEITVEKPADWAGIFKYYDSSGSPWTPGPSANVNDIRRVEISIIVKTGSGLFQNWDSYFQTTSGVDIKQFL